MKRYGEDIKAQALASINAVGVKKTSEEMGLSIQTLYKWRNEGKKPSASKGIKEGKSDDLIQIIKEDAGLQKKIQQLEEENANLRKTIARMKKAFAAMFE